MPSRPGSIDVRILDGPVAPPAKGTVAEDAGAECVFLGRTRRDVHPEHGALQRLSYEAYVPLAERTLRELATDAAGRFDCRLVRVHHAVGEVPVGEASVLVQVVAGHRDEAFRACRWLIDTLKARAPIWKRERWADGASWSPGTPVAPGQSP